MKKPKSILFFPNSINWRTGTRQTIFRLLRDWKQKERLMSRGYNDPVRWTEEVMKAFQELGIRVTLPKRKGD